jgi:uncharacterized protein YyaL (SSP411 family)
MASTQAANRLAGQTSPYLLQHAHNPVDWYPWSAEALARARAENKPILLSIGYAACHWCHVMAHESFDDPSIAALMNAHFVCIKVDREERPDLDDIYMAATLASSGSGGWPMTVFMTPDQEPFFAGTYFPPDSRGGLIGFRQLLTRVRDLWNSDASGLRLQAQQLTGHLRALAEPTRPSAVPEDLFWQAAADLADAFDPVHGGFGSAPKFPPSSALSLLLRAYRKRQQEPVLVMVRTTLDAMQRGGIYDQLAGGFARYSTDERWLVPHFEKMLYDNAQLASVYLEAFQVTGAPEYRRVASETLDYVLREMQDPEGGYYSSTDADSEGVEGKFFVFTPAEIHAVLERPVAELFCAYYDVTPEGNWEGQSILNTPRPLAEVAQQFGLAPAEAGSLLASGRQRIYEVRRTRVPPQLDDKVLTSWNGLMIAAMADGARILGTPAYFQSAERAARFALTRLKRPDAGLFRTSRQGRVHLEGYLEDYAFLADGLLNLYEAAGWVSPTIEPRELLEAARQLAERLLSDFGAEDGSFYATAHAHEALLVRLRDNHDGALPSANAVAARVLVRLGHHLDRREWIERGTAALEAHGASIARAPRAFATSLNVLEACREGALEVVAVGRAGDPSLVALLREAAKVYLPHAARAFVDPAQSAASVWPTPLPLLEGKLLVSGAPALYVCRNFSCLSPVTKPGEVVSALASASADTLARAFGDPDLSAGVRA